MSSVYQNSLLLAAQYLSNSSMPRDSNSIPKQNSNGIKLSFSDPAEALAKLFAENRPSSQSIVPKQQVPATIAQSSMVGPRTSTNQKLERVLSSQIVRLTQWSELSDAQRLSTTLQTVSLIGGVLRDSQQLTAGTGNTNQQQTPNAPSDLQLLNQSIGLIYGIQNFDAMNTAQQGAFLVNGLQQSTQILDRLGIDPLTADINSALGSFAPYVNGLASSISYIENFEDLNELQQVVGGAEIASFAARLGQNASTSLGSASTSNALGQVAGPLGSIASYAASAYAAYDIIDNFGSLSNEQGAIDGATIGASIGSAFSPLGTVVGAGVGAVAGLALSQFNSGKDPEQKERDIYRAALQEAGIIDADYQLTLADGAKYDIGIDDRYDREWFDKNLIGDNPFARDKLQPFDVDYTNNLDFTVSIAGTTLSRLLFGSSSQNDTISDQIGGYFTNAAISQTGRDFSERNFQNGINNMLSLYNQMGLRSPEDVIARARQLAGEGKINELEYTQALQAADLVFNQQFSSAERLVESRF
jgi:hypothetical protein